MRFITRLLSVSALGLALGLASMGAASAQQTNPGPPGCYSQCCQAPNWNPSQGPWDGQNQCCQGGDHDHWGMGQSECCPSPGGVVGLFAAFNHGANCFQQLQCTFPGRHHKHNKHHKHHKHHHNWQGPGMFC